MNAKEYMNQAYRLDQRINSKLEQLESLNALATKSTTSLDGMPKSSRKSKSPMAETVVKIVDLQKEINQDIDRLVDLKREYIKIIKEVENPEHQMILEKRYLCFKTWEQIAVDLGYSIQHIYRKRNEALRKIKLPIKKDESKC